MPQPVNDEEAEVEWFYEDLQGLLELTPPKRYPFHILSLGIYSLCSGGWFSR